MNAVAPIASPGAIVDVAATIKEAGKLFDKRDYQAALLLSSGAYEQAKAGANYAAKVKASQQLVGKARQMQADALKIESYCYVAIANAVDEAQSKGRLAKPGRKSNVQGLDIFTLEDVGIDRRRLLEARKLRDAERDRPGFINQVVEGRIALGLEPSRANLRAAIGTSSATNAERGDNFYQTPPEAMQTLIALEGFASVVLDPSVGKGASSRPLEEAGYDVMVSDLVDRGYVTMAGKPQAVGDFLLSMPPEGDAPDICSNPPYGAVLNAFVAHALKVWKPRKMALLLNLNFQCGFADDDRNFVMDENPPARIYVFKRRLPMMHREGWDGPTASSRMNTAWFIWELQTDETYGDVTVTRRVDWMDFVDADAIEPGEGGHAGDIAFREDFTRETPRRSLDERVADERARALIWAAEQESFDAVELRRGISRRPSTAEGLISALHSEGLIRPSGEIERWTVSDNGWLALKATAGLLIASPYDLSEVLHAGT